MTTKAPDFNAAADMTALFEAVTALSTVLENENQALLESDFSVSGLLAGTKRDAIARLESLIGLARKPGPRHQNRMTAVQRRLDEAISNNRVLLQRSIDTQQRVIATVVQALEPADQDSTYPAQYRAEANHRPSLPVALILRA